MKEQGTNLLSAGELTFRLHGLGRERCADVERASASYAPYDDRW